MADDNVNKVEGIVVEAMPMQDQKKQGDICCEYSTAISRLFADTSIRGTLTTLPSPSRFLTYSCSPVFVLLYILTGGCCCDFRRAVIVISIIEIVFYTIYTIMAATGSGLASNLIEDDELRVETSTTTGIMAIGFAFGIAFGVFQLFAALRYNVCMLGTCLLLQLVGIGYNAYYSVASVPEPRSSYAGMIATNLIVGVVCSILLYIYPTAMLIKEINAGTMSRETYPREAHSCCCDPKV